MINIKQFYNCLLGNGVDFITGVPDSLLNDFCNYVQENMAEDKHVIAANEGNAIALAAGYNLATGTIPLVYMQNSGLGNSLNPLLSLTNKEVFSIPMVLLVGWRGDPSISDHVQHEKQGYLTMPLLDSADIPSRILVDDTAEALAAAEWAIKTAGEKSGPVALVVKKNVLTKDKKIEPEVSVHNKLLSREEAIDCVLQKLPDDTRYVATTGRATREIHSLREKHGQPHDKDFLNLGAMGHASSIAAGIALGARGIKVVCLDGDAGLIMHLGSLTTAGKLELPNFIHIVFNNGVHESVGGQPSAGYISNLTAIAENAGYETIGVSVDTKEAIEEALQSLLKTVKPKFLEIVIRKGISDDLGPLKIDQHNLKDQFVKSILES